MNPTIVKIIDLMFRDIPENEETNAMREELLTNSQARYEDLIAAGESPDTALGQVLDNLRGMEDVLDEYRSGHCTVASSQQDEDRFPFAKFERMAEEIDDKFERMADKAEAMAKNAYTSAMGGIRSAMDSVSNLFDQPGEQTYESAQASYTIGNPTRSASGWSLGDDSDTLTLSYAPGQVTRLNVQLTGEDIEVEPSHDGMVHVEISKQDENLFLVDVLNGCLTIRRNPHGSVSAPEQPAQPEELEGLGGIFSGISQALKNVFQFARTCGDTVRLLLPDHMEQITLQTASGDIDLTDLRQKALSASTTSGDVEVSGCAFSGEVLLNSTSGDIDATRCDFAAPLMLNTTSGDLEVQANAPTVTVNTTSGDAEVEGLIQRIKANTVSGDLDFTLTGAFDSIQVNSTSGDLSVSLPEDAAPSVRTSTVSGSVDVSCPINGSSPSTITLSSVSGDLSVHNF